MDKFNRDWIISNAVDILEDYNYGEVTLRALHYRLVSRGMTNTSQHYKRVVAAMRKARWDGTVAFGHFADHEREVLGRTRYEITRLEDEVTLAKEAIQDWMKHYNKNRWENQTHYIEVWIEKKALQGVFQPVCRNNRVALAPCKGYPSLTFLHEAAERLSSVPKDVTILYFGDYDPSGEDIPRSLQENLEKMGCDVTVDRRLLLEWQVREWQLPPAPVKTTDSRTAAWDGIGQVELDAVEPRELKTHIQSAINEYFDADLHDKLQEIEEEERKEYRAQLKAFVNNFENDE